MEKRKNLREMVALRKRNKEWVELYHFLSDNEGWTVADVYELIQLRSDKLWMPACKRNGVLLSC